MRGGVLLLPVQRDEFADIDGVQSPERDLQEGLGPQEEQAAVLGRPEEGAVAAQAQWARRRRAL